MRVVIELKRDANAQVVLNQLYKHTQLQDTFGTNLLALVDGVPRTLTLDQALRHYVEHQVDVITRRTRYRLRKCRGAGTRSRGSAHRPRPHRRDHRAHPKLSPPPTMRSRDSMERFELSEIQAQAILDMQLRRLAALERQRIQDEYDELR
jgi:DNA gyrase subunit A